MHIQKILRSLFEKLFPAAAIPTPIPIRNIPPVKELKLYCLKDPVTKKLQTLTYHMNKCPCGRN